jgi:hypothetical protein
VTSYSLNDINGRLHPYLNRHIVIILKCPECGAKVPPQARSCVACLTDVGFPNVRLAEQADEQLALGVRLRNAKTSAVARGAGEALTSFGVAVADSQAVVAREIGVLDSFVKSENSLYISYHPQVRSGARIPEDNKWDLGRTSAESTVNPLFYEDIAFACISLDGIGPSGYGDYHITIKSRLIERRTTVFEENVFSFCQRHRVIAGDAPPLGYRAPWEQRDRLAMAKLQPRISPTTKPDQFPGILVKPGTHSGDGEFIEAHIFGPLHRSVIERVIGPKPKNRANSILWRSIQKNLRDIGAATEERI